MKQNKNKKKNDLKEPFLTLRYDEDDRDPTLFICDENGKNLVPILYISNKNRFVKFGCKYNLEEKGYDMSKIELTDVGEIKVI